MTNQSNYPQKERLPVNDWPLNRLAKQWLLQGNLEHDPTRPYLLQLLDSGFTENVPLPGQGSQFQDDLAIEAGKLLSHRYDPSKIMIWLLSNPNGPEMPEQSETLQAALEAAGNWREAAQVVMETFYDRLAAENPNYQP